jgi:hypothetical protein
MVRGEDDGRNEKACDGYRKKEINRKQTVR